jgi:hypothetical protein
MEVMNVSLCKMITIAIHAEARNSAKQNPEKKLPHHLPAQKEDFPAHELIQQYLKSQ